MSEAVTTKAPELKISQGGSMINGSYRIQRLIATDGTTAPVMSMNSTVEQEFELPAKVFNLSKSYLTYNLTARNENGVFNKLHLLGACEIDRISLQTRGGTYLVDINHAGRVSKMLAPASTSFEEFLGNPSHQTAAVVADIAGIGKKLACSNDVGGGTALVLGGDSDKFIDGVGVLRAPYTKYKAYQQLQTGAVGDNANQGDVSIKVQLNLGDIFPHTLFALNKDLFFAGEILRLKVHWKNTSGFIFTSNAADGVGAAGAPVREHLMSNVYLHLAVENDPDVSAAVVNNVMTNGLSLQIPYIHTRKQTTGDTVDQTATNKYNLGHGRRMHRIYTSSFRPDAAPYVNNNCNVGEELIRTYDTSIDGVKQMDYAWDDDAYWLHKQSEFKGSAVCDATNATINFVHIENFDANKSIMWRKLDDEQVSRGIDLSQELLYSYDTTRDGRDFALEILQVAVVEKQLAISPQGIVLS